MPLIKNIFSKDNIKTFLVISMILFALIASYNIHENNQKKIYEIAIIIRDQKMTDNDCSNLLKRGDIWKIKEKGYDWEKPELISYLILEIRLTEEQSKRILDQLTNLNTQSKQQYRVKIENFDFLPTDLLKGQPFKDKIYSWKIIEKK